MTGLVDLGPTAMLPRLVRFVGTLALQVLLQHKEGMAILISGKHPQGVANS